MFEVHAEPCYEAEKRFFGVMTKEIFLAVAVVLLAIVSPTAAEERETLTGAQALLREATQAAATLKQSYATQNLFREIVKAQLRVRDIDGVIGTASMIQDKGDRIDALWQIAKDRVEADDADGAWKFVRQALEIIPTIEAVGAKNFAIYKMVETQLDLGDVQGASKIAAGITDDPNLKSGVLQQIDSFRKGKWRTVRSQAVTRMKSVHRSQFYEAIDNALRSQEPSSSVHESLSRAVKKEESGDRTGALEQIREAVAGVAVLEGHGLRRVINLLEIAKAQVQGSDKKGSLATFRYAAKAAYSIKEEHLKLVALVMIAQQEVEANEFKFASDNARAGIELALSLQNECGTCSADALADLALVERAIGNKAKAEKMIKDGIQIAQSADDELRRDQERKNSSFGRLVEAQAKMGDIDGALRTLHLVADQDGSYGPHLTRLAEIQSRSGDIENVLVRVKSLSSPFERALTLLGAANGIIERERDDRR